MNFNVYIDNLTLNLSNFSLNGQQSANGQSSSAASSTTATTATPMDITVQTAHQASQSTFSSFSFSTASPQPPVIAVQASNIQGLQINLPPSSDKKTTRSAPLFRNPKPEGKKYSFSSATTDNLTKKTTPDAAPSSNKRRQLENKTFQSTQTEIVEEATVDAASSASTDNCKGKRKAAAFENNASTVITSSVSASSSVNLTTRNIVQVKRNG